LSLLAGCHTLGSGAPDLAANDMVISNAAEAICHAAADGAVADSGEFSLADAIAFALSNNPRLREALARISEVRAGEAIAFAAFLPDVGTSVRYSGFNVPVLPGGAFVPISLNGGVHSFSLAEAGVQWTLCDFGRTAGRYGQAQMQTVIAERQADRARETV